MVRGDGSGLIPYPLSEPAAADVACSVVGLTAGFTGLLGEVSEVDRSTILLLGVLLLRPDELVCISLVVAAGIGLSLRNTEGSRATG